MAEGTRSLQLIRRPLASHNFLDARQLQNRQKPSLSISKRTDVIPATEALVKKALLFYEATWLLFYEATGWIDVEVQESRE